MRLQTEAVAFLVVGTGIPVLRLLSAHWELALKIRHFCFVGGCFQRLKFQHETVERGSRQTLGSCLFPVCSAVVTISKSNSALSCFTAAGCWQENL